MNSFLKSLVFLWLFGFLISCNEESEDGDSSYANISNNFFTSTDISKPLNLNSLSQSEALANLAGLDDIYANSPEEDGEDEEDETSKCLTDLIEKAGLTIKGDTLTIGFGSNNDECLKNAFTDTMSQLNLKVSTIEFEFKNFYNIKCAGVDFTKYEGRKFSEIEKELEDETSECTSQEYLFNMFLSFDMSAQSTEDESINVNIKTVSKNFKGTKNFEACILSESESSWVTSDDCIFVEVSEQEMQFGTGDPTYENSYTRLTPSSLVESTNKTSLWYQSGSIEAMINDWTGTLNYSSIDTAPTYEITNSAGLSASGSLAPQNTSLKITDVPREFDRVFKKISQRLSSLNLR
ncbi:MAG: hypothetical protein AB8G05_07270 [Oligoflexales bacterium]